MDVRDYIVIHKQYLDADFCADTIKQVEEHRSEFEKHSFYTPITNSRNSYTDDFNTFYGSLELSSKILDAIKEVSSQYAHKYDLPPLQGFTHPRFNIYDSNTNMKKHSDHIHSIFDGSKKGIPTISVLIGLNEDYEGGELIFFDDQEYKLETGSIILFPSNFIYPHKVNTITKGVRYSVVSWIF